MINNDIILTVIFYLFLFTWFIQLIYYLFIYLKFAGKTTSEAKTVDIPVSVVICARNESKNLEKYLPLILEQNYQNYEVIVVNDCSDDETEDVLNRLKAKYPHLRTTFLKEQGKFTHGKKLALTIGIKAAQYEWLLLTDADCMPVSKEWISTMAEHFNDNKSIVLGYGGYIAYPGFLNKLIRFDTATIALQYFSFALIHVPYMGVGRNLAYKKSLFFENKGFASHIQIDSGDDDLFINQIANSSNVAIEWRAKSHTRTEPKKRFSDWVEQKKRHLTTFKKYKTKHKLLLGLEVFTRVIFYIVLIFLLINKFYYQLVIALFCLRLIIQLITWKLLFNKLEEKHIFIFSLLFDILMPFINLYIYILNKVRPYKRWR
jgi:glycosyltransferase involved in cell wall biosynthesis